MPSFLSNTTLCGEFVQTYVISLLPNQGMNGKGGSCSLTFENRNFLLQAFGSPDRL